MGPEEGASRAGRGIELDASSYRRALNNLDLWLRIASTASAEELEQLLDAQLSVMVIFEFEFERRFPVQHRRWDEKSRR
jgi:hypothetical protein